MRIQVNFVCPPIPTRNTRKTALFTNVRLDEATGCWNWTAHKDICGYGVMHCFGGSQKVHRVSAKLYLGFDLLSPLLVLHKCDNPACFNPKHLFIGTHKDNQEDAVRKGRHHEVKKTVCPRGHAYDLANTRYSSNGWRFCRACDRENQKELRRERREHKSQCGISTYPN